VGAKFLDEVTRNLRSYNVQIDSRGKLHEPAAKVTMLLQKSANVAGRGLLKHGEKILFFLLEVRENARVEFGPQRCDVFAIVGLESRDEPFDNAIDSAMIGKESIANGGLRMSSIGVHEVPFTQASCLVARLGSFLAACGFVPLLELNSGKLSTSTLRTVCTRRAKSALR
jgi:hypothetical protein